MDYKNNKTANRRRYKSRYHSPHNYKTKRSKSENRAAILIGIATFIVLASLVLVFTFGDNIYTFLDSTFHPQSIIKEEKPTAVVLATEATEAPTEAPTPAPTQAPTVAQSDEFNAMLTQAGITVDQLTGSQAIFVKTSGTTCTVYTYEKDKKGVWNKKFEPMEGYTGEDGAAADSVPYDSVTPYGTYHIEYAMGTNPNPGTALEYFYIVEGMRWVTDPSSVNYNRMVDGDATYIDFDDCQDLDIYTRSYPYCVIFDYNRDPVDNSKGCAKFLHVSDRPTYGGVGVSEDEMYNILMWLNPSASPTITIF